MKVLISSLRSRGISPPKQLVATQPDPLKTHKEERRLTNIDLGKEYDIPQHLYNIPAEIPVFELNKSSPKYQKQLFDTMEKMQIPSDTTPKLLTETESAIVNYSGALPITFTDQELERVPISSRIAQLNLIVTVAGYRIQGAFFDTGASLNICLIHTFHMIGLVVNDRSPVPMTIVGNNRNRKVACGHILRLTRTHWHP